MKVVTLIGIGFCALLLLSVGSVHAEQPKEKPQKKTTPVVTWSTPAPIRFGVELGPTQLNATASVQGTFAYTPPGGTVLPVGPDQTLSVKFTPDDTEDYRVVNNTHVQITVNPKEDPVITWANPADITYGTALGSSQLNATADVSGTFSYSPSSGTVLSAAANQVLTANFTPTDGVNNNSVITTVHINVNKASLTATASSTSRVYGASNPVFTIIYTGFVHGDTPAVIHTAPTATCVAIVSSGAGNTFPIVPGGGVDDNYIFTYVSGTLVVDKAAFTATANNQIRLYGLPNPPLTILYSGFVNGDTPAAIDTPPVVSTSATTSSPVGTYEITVSSGADNNYIFNYVSGILSIVTSPTINNFKIETKEDAEFVFGYAIFNKNFSGYAGDSIVSIKIVQPPANGYLFWLGKKIKPGDEIAVAHGTLNDFVYSPNANYTGADAVTWNVFDGMSTARTDAHILITVIPVNHPPVLANMEQGPLLYDRGDKPTPITETVMLTNAENGFMFGARIALTENYKNGDLLELDGASYPKITSAFDSSKGELVLSGKDSRSNYEAALHHVLFSSPISGDTSRSIKQVVLVVKDSINESNLASRIIQITNAFPELSIVNAFTPNSDKVNDYWDFVNLQFYKEIKIAVFDQNGIRVFDCGDRDCKWDGKIKGKELPAGSYFYSINLESGKRTYRGTVTILK